MSRFTKCCLITLLLHTLTTIGISSWFYHISEALDAKKSDTLYFYGSPLEKLLSSFESSLAFDCLIFLWSFISFFLIRYMNKPISKIIILIFFLLFWGKAMAGCFYLLEESNKNFHENSQRTLDNLKNRGADVPNELKAWEVSYWTVVASVAGYFGWIAGVGVGVGVETKKKVEMGLV